MGDRAWYHEGLRFRCTGCGECCTGDPGFVWVTDEEIARLAAECGLDREQFEANYVRQVGSRKSLIEHENGDCVLFDPHARACRAYRARPRQCQTWPFWSSNVRTPADWKQVCRVCPGSGKGPVVPLTTIQARISSDKRL